MSASSVLQCYNGAKCENMSIIIKMKTCNDFEFIAKIRSTWHKETNRKSSQEHNGKIEKLSCLVNIVTHIL